MSFNQNNQNASTVGSWHEMALLGIGDLAAVREPFWACLAEVWSIPNAEHHSYEQ